MSVDHGMLEGLYELGQIAVCSLGRKEQSKLCYVKEGFDQQQRNREVHHLSVNVCSLINVRSHSI